MKILQDTLLVLPLKIKRKSFVHSYLFLELQWAVELGARSENRLPTSMIISHNPTLKEGCQSNDCRQTFAKDETNALLDINESLSEAQPAVNE